MNARAEWKRERSPHAVTTEKAASVDIPRTPDSVEVTAQMSGDAARSAISLLSHFE